MDRYAFLKANGERVGAVLAAVVGAIALLLGWIGVSGKGLTTQQIPYIVSGAVFGLFALGVGATLWISAALRDEWRKLNDIHELLAADDAEAATYAPYRHDGESVTVVKPTANGQPAKRARAKTATR